MHNNAPDLQQRLATMANYVSGFNSSTPEFFIGIIDLYVMDRILR